jgi:hypothetical protein
MVGGSHPTGDMERHPKDHVIRLNIFFVLCKQQELFTRILSSSGLIRRLAFTAGPFEMLKYRKVMPGNISLKQLIYFLLLHISWFSTIRLAFNQKRQIVFNFGEKAHILKIPGQ